MFWKFTPFKAGRKVCALLPALLLTSYCFSQSIFQPSDAPAIPLLNDGQPVQTGVKFQASQNGYIKGIRYYKGAGSTGTRTGQLWTATGALVASAVFTNETASGWQEVLFTTPYAINANTTYVATCFSSSGDYAVTNSYFNQPVVNGSLRALANDEEGPNGVYIYSQIPMFPANGYMANNYWVDVVFTEYTGPDTQAPFVTSTAPSAAATGVALTPTISAVFNEALDPTTVSGATAELRHTASNTLVPASVSYIASSRSIVLTPTSAFPHSTSYTVTIKGGTSGIKDIAGNTMVADYTWNFVSLDLPFIDPSQGYGGPILVLSSAGNPFSTYTAEILRAEGLTAFRVKDIAAITTQELNEYDVIIAGEIDATSAQITLLSQWINAGGTFIAFKPRPSLAPLTGLTATGNVLSNKYLKIHTTSGPGMGIVGETIQFHGDANIYTANGAKSIATLYADANTATVHPAVTMMEVGNNGGKAIAFTYDLPSSVVYTRQGNPAWAGQERDGQHPIRSNDLFYGLPANTGADWIDFNKIAIPQADEQQRLLANIIIQGNLHRKPLPRLWYLPRSLKAAIVMTGDDHATNGTAGRFNLYKTLGPNTPEDVADWFAVRATSYVYPGTPISNTQAAAFEEQGFEVAMHPSTDCSNFTEASLDGVIGSQLNHFNSLYPDVSSPVTNRTHCLVWSDWSSQAKVEAKYGMRLDVNYYYWPGSWVQNQPGMFTGSGMPMRFADASGALIDCYQVTTQMTDESGIDFSSFSQQLLDKAVGPEGYYGTFCANMHTDSAQHTGASTIIAAAQSRKIPVISSKQLLNWLDGRNNTRFDSISWNNHTLRFHIYAPSGARNARGMLPRFIGNAQLTSIKREGVSVWDHAERIKGMDYIFFQIAVGSFSYVAEYTATPGITQQPVTQSVCDGNTVSFTCLANGEPAPTVQWEVSTDGTNWAEISGASGTTLSFVATVADNNNKYRAVWSNSNGFIVSDAATLTVKAKPVLSGTLTPGPVASGSVFNYTAASVTPGTSFQWNRVAVTGISNLPASGTTSINETLVNTTDVTIPVTYVYTLTANGCANTQSVVVDVTPVTGCSFSTSITANFNSTSVPSGRYLWFNSVFKPSNAGNSTVNFYVTNSKITYTLNNQLVTLNVPNAHIKLSSSVSIASVKYVNNTWETEAPIGYNGNIFMAGLAYKLTQTLPGGVKNITWSADIEADKPGVSIEWKWTAGVYTNFSTHPNLTVNPVDGLLSILNPLLGIANAGTPINYMLNIAAGAMGSGLINITSTYSATKRETCTSARLIATAGSVHAIDGKGGEAIPEPAVETLSVRALPNPSHDQFSLVIDAGNNKPLTINIYDISGRLIQRIDRSYAGAIQLGGTWHAGTYLAEVIQGDQRRMVKLVKAQ